jgi:DNA polymerase-3 subunit epsilon
LDHLLLSAIPFAVVDVETTGGGVQQGHRITEVAVVPVRGGVIGRPFSTLVNPERDIPTVVQRITGITPEMVAQAPDFQDIAPSLRPLLDGALFTAHNVRFDWGFVAAEMEAAGQPLAVETPRLCTVRLGRSLHPGLESYSLGPLARALEVANPARHRALGDALATAHILLHLLRRAEAAGLDDMAALLAWARAYGGVGRKRQPPVHAPVQAPVQASVPPPVQSPVPSSLPPSFPPSLPGTSFERGPA